MNLAKLSANGQITVPVEIRRLLGLKSGDKILFFQNQGGEVVVANASAQALSKVQDAFAGLAEKLGKPGAGSGKRNCKRLGRAVCGERKF